MPKCSPSIYTVFPTFKMVPYNLLPLALCFIYTACHAHRPEDCTEVGYARAGGSLIHRAYAETKGRVLERWAEEDRTGRPTYAQLSPALKNVTRSAYLLEEVSKDVLALISKTRVGKRCKGDWMLKGLEKHMMPLTNIDTALADDLGLVMSFSCMVGSPYPNVDGTCVSDKSPDLGAMGSKFLRLLPSQPGLDGFALRRSVSDAPLPSARAVAQVLREELKPSATTQLFADWSHFVQQDIFSIPESPLAEGVDCCQTPDAEDCAPITVPEGDPLHSEQSCFNFRRSALAQAILGHREAFSIISTYLDATPLYGPTNEEAFRRKTGFFGYLKGGERLEEESSKCKFPESFEGCVELDDSIEMVPSLRALLMLEHNRIADGLAELNPHFDDALLYNEARRVIIAQYAAITYGLFLPTLMGDEIVKKHFLLPGTEGPAGAYLSEVNPGVLTSFATAAFRNPSMATEWQATQAGRDEVFGSVQYNSVATLPYQDLLAMDVQRGRDHGLTGYVAWRRFCDPGFVLDSWDDLKNIFPEATVAALKELYSSELEDMDAMVALLEPPVEGGVAGKTFTCLMADQYARLRTGNRLYWEHEAALLTKEQQEVLRNTSLASILCSNLPVTAVPTNPLLPVSEGNPLVDCAELKPLNLTVWVDTSLIESMKAAGDSQKKEEEQQQQKVKEDDDDEHKPEVESQVTDGQTLPPTDDYSKSSSSSSSSSTATASDAGDGQPTVRMAGSAVAGQRLTTADKDEL